jgi:hypothetical protein
MAVGGSREYWRATVGHFLMVPSLDYSTIVIHKCNDMFTCRKEQSKGLDYRIATPSRKTTFNSRKFSANSEHAQTQELAQNMLTARKQGSVPISLAVAKTFQEKRPLSGPALAEIAPQTFK